MGTTFLSATMRKRKLEELEKENARLKGGLIALEEKNEALRKESEELDTTLIVTKLKVKSDETIRLRGLLRMSREENDELRKENEELKEINERIELYTRRRG